MQSASKQVYPEDLSCIIDSIDGRGGLYIGNLEAAQNINTLKSTPSNIQSSKYAPSSPLPRESRLDTPSQKSLTSSMCLLRIMSLLTSVATSIRPPPTSTTASSAPTSWSTASQASPAQSPSSWHTSSSTAA